MAAQLRALIPHVHSKNAGRRVADRFNSIDFDVNL